MCCSESVLELALMIIDGSPQPIELRGSREIVKLRVAEPYHEHYV